MTYDYECTQCQHAWEATQSIHALPLELCPECGVNAAKRVISKPGEFLLKGGGWYADGYGTRKVAA
jgi:putative FmdB family regulatory protein